MFVAYAAPDRQRARALYDGLRAEGLEVCFDQAVLRPGDNWHDDLPRHLRSSTVVVALVSQHTGAAHYENEELIMAIDQVRREGGRLVPLRLQAGAPLPYGTGALHALDYLDDDATPSVVAAIADVVRNPSTRPLVVGTQVWCPRVPALPVVFAGRDELVERLRASTSGGAAAVLTQTIGGMGGVGKTTVAAALAEAQRHALDVVWWVRAEQPAVAVADLAELAPRVGLAAHDDPHDTADAVRDWLETTDRSWLLIFDNAPDESSVDRWRPRRGNGATLITSRNRNMGRLGKVIVIDTFPDDVAEAFLRERVRETNAAAAAEDLADVLARLEGLALALEQAAAWVERVPNRRFADYAALFDDASKEPFPDGTRPLGYDHTATTAWRVSIDAAAAEAACAPRLLEILSFLAPEGLPCAWLRELATAGDPYLGATTAEVDDALAAVHGYSLVEVSEADTVGLHRVVQAAARRHAPPEAAGSAIALLRAQADGNASDHTRWPTLARLVPHALAAAATAGAALPPRASELWWVLDDLTVYHRSRGATSDAIAAGTLALDLATTHLGPEHPNTLTSRNSLAGAYGSAGDLSRAIPLFEATLADRQRVLGPDHPDTLTSRNNLASAYESAGDLGRAIPLFEATLADRQRVLGPDHPDTLSSGNNLAGAYQSAGDLGRAIPLFEADPGRQPAGAGPRPPRHPHQPQQPGLRLQVGGGPGPGHPPPRGHPGRPPAGAGPRPPRHPHQPQQPGRRLPSGRGPGPGHPPLRGHSWPTASGCWAPTTPTPSPAATTWPTPTSRPGTWAGPSPSTRPPGRLPAGAGPRPPRHPRQPQQPGRRLPIGRGPGPGHPPLRGHPGRPRAGAGPRPPRHPLQPQQPGLRLLLGRGPGPRHPPLRGHPGRPPAGAGPRPPRHPRQPQQPGGGTQGPQR